MKLLIYIILTKKIVNDLPAPKFITETVDFLELGPANGEDSTSVTSIGFSVKT